MTALRILLIGKRGSLVLWLENLHRACIQSGYVTRIFAVNGDTLVSRLRVKWRGYTAMNADWMLMRFEQTLRKFRPDLIIAAGVFGVPLEYYQIVRKLPHRPLIAGLIGDRFPPDNQRANYCDRLYFTDSRFFSDAETANFRVSGCYLPLAVDPTLFKPGHVLRHPELLFVASRTEFRENVVRTLRRPARIIGTDWSSLTCSRLHQVQNHKISRAALIRLYQSYQTVLNVRNEINVENGLNQRSFEPLACGAVVLNDDLADLPRCFDPGREILIYRNSDELNELINRLQREPAFGMQVAEAGRQRVLAEHTYQHRIQFILNDLGLHS